MYIVRCDFDFWYELAKEEDNLAQGEEPTLGPDGFSYYVSFSGIGADESFWPDTIGFGSLQAAKEAALLKVPSGITWSNGA